MSRSKVTYSLWWGLGFGLTMTVLGTSLLLLDKMFPSFGEGELFLGATASYFFRIFIWLMLPGMVLRDVLPGRYILDLLCQLETSFMTDFEICLLIVTLLFYFFVGIVIGWLFYWYPRESHAPRKNASNQFVSLDLSSKTQKEE